jgi:hypothetical protein
VGNPGPGRRVAGKERGFKIGCHMVLLIMLSFTTCQCSINDHLACQGPMAGLNYLTNLHFVTINILENWGV